MQDSCLQGHYTPQDGVSAERAASSRNAENLHPLSTSHSDTPQDNNLQIHQHEKLKSHTLQCFVTIMKREQILQRKEPTTYI